MKKIVLVAFIFLTGCKLYDVSADNSNKGIPFFSHEIIETTSETYQEKYYEISLEITREILNMQNAEEKEKNKKGPNKAKPSNPKKEDDSKPEEFTSKLVCYANEGCSIELNNNLAANEMSFKEKIDFLEFALSNTGSCKYFQKPFPIRKEPISITDETTNDLALSLISKTRTNTVQPSPKTHYINVKKAASGTTDGSITLNANGTLASAEASTSEELIGQIIEALPISEVLSSFIPAPEGTAAEEGIEEMIEDSSFVQTKRLSIKAIKLTLTPITRMYEINHMQNLNRTNDKFIGLKITETKGTSSKKEEKPKDDDKQEIKLSGTVTLPKAEAEKKN